PTNLVIKAPAALV
ncbi:HAMP domain protein, partial [Vibrio parahaemolyticus V-223/04]